MAGSVTFFLNGESITIEDPSPDLLLIDYLRSQDVGLTGAKKGCGEGGCGACTVILSRWDAATEQVSHHAINSCLRPVCALGGLAITTVEGTGWAAPLPPAFPSHATTFSRTAAPAAQHAPKILAARQRTKAVRSQRLQVAPAASGDGPPPPHPPQMNPVAYRLAVNNGSQCGYCSVGFVMNMSALLAHNPAPTKREIENVFDGNLCRCTGYRPILTGMKTFASNWTPEDEANRMKCLLEDGRVAPDLPGVVEIPFPPAAHAGATPVTVDGHHQRWVTPTSLADLLATLRGARGQRVRMVHGNTSFGVYPDEFSAAELLVDLRMIKDLYGAEIMPTTVEVGAATTFSELIEVLERADPSRSETTRLGALLLMARRTAGTIVRNAGTLAGNTMMVLSHIHEGEPFPSDSLTALTAITAEVEVIEIATGARSWIRATELIREVIAQPTRPSELLLVRYRLPRGIRDEVVLSQKVALREINAHSLVNATTRLGFGAGTLVDDAVLVFGGIAPHPWHAVATEAALRGRPLHLADFPALAAILAKETWAALHQAAPRLRGLVYEGITDQYRVDLVVSFLYKMMVNALLDREPSAVPPEVKSAGVSMWGRWPDSTGQQHYATQAYKQPVGQPYIKLEAMLQTSGQLHYTQELALPPRGENGAFAQSLRALASYFFQVPGDRGPVSADRLREHLAQRFPAFTGLITYHDIPQQGINYQGMGLDQPLFAVKQVSYVGQAIALILARSEQDAIRIAQYVTQTCIGYGKPTWSGTWPHEWYEPILSLDRAIEMNSVYPDYPTEATYVSHIWKITRPGSRLDWVAPRDPLDKQPEARLGDVDGRPCQIVGNTQTAGGQIHFYMETQACVVDLADDHQLIVHPSSQSPMEMHQTSAMAVGEQYNRIEVQISPLGGGYGGKTEQARFVTGPAVVAATSRQRAIRIAMARAADSAMIGKRHPYYGQYQIAVDLGERRNARGEVEIDPTLRGIIRGLSVRFWGDGGAFYDCSFIVSNCIQLRADNCYRIANFQTQLDVCRTNTAPNTAFRAFGDIQGKLIIENAVDDAAFALAMPDHELREKNMYDLGDVTPFGQPLSYCYMKQVWAYLKVQCDYLARHAAVEAFNRANRWTKRGIAMLPNKYGSGYNLAQLEQAAAVMSIYAGDGSIRISQGGVDMGQGLITQAAQVASYVLNVPLEMITIQRADTAVIPNPTSSGASTGTPYAAEAVKRVCETMRGRLTEFAYGVLKEQGEAYCKQQNIDFWNYGTQGWAATVPDSKPPRLIWQNIVALANQQRIGLVCSDTALISGGTTELAAVGYKPLAEQPQIPGIEVMTSGPLGGPVGSFSGFTYSAACSEVEVDILTGEVKILRSDIVYDAGWSLNPALDVGQVEGAFIQGVGYVMSESLVYQPDGDERGRLNTTNTWRYKVPATTSIPLELNVFLFPRNLAGDVPENPNNIFSAKEIGEPPLVLANSVFFAVKAAIRSSRLERGLPGLFRFDAPATVQEVRRACEVSTSE